MKTFSISAQHLQDVRNLLQAARKELSDASAEADAAFAKRAPLSTKVAVLSATFDKLAAGFGNGEGIGEAVAEQFPEEIRKLIGFVKEEPPAPEPIPS